ncbi:MAG: hypothetical protein HYU64_19310 [Armatimonadetes bacterium]|nr:hypothetical protein [Armatimonadota bacterium]
MIRDLEAPLASDPRTPSSFLPRLITAPQKATVLISNLKSPGELWGMWKQFAAGASLLLLAVLGLFRIMLWGESAWLYLLVGFAANAGLILAGLALEADHMLVLDPAGRRLQFQRWRLGFQVKEAAIPVSALKAIEINYEHCAGCDAIFGRRFPKDPEVFLLLKNGERIRAGEYDHKPSEEFISSMGYTGLLEEIEIRKAHTTLRGLCESCQFTHMLRSSL